MPMPIRTTFNNSFVLSLYESAIMINFFPIFAGAPCKRIRNSNCIGVVLVPYWPASDFYNDFFSANKTKKPFVHVKDIQPYVYQNEHAMNTAMFDLLLLSLLFYTLTLTNVDY